MLPVVPAPAGRGLGWLVLALAGGMLAYAAAAAAQRSPELHALVGMLRRRGGTLPPPARR